MRLACLPGGREPLQADGRLLGQPGLLNSCVRLIHGCTQRERVRDGSYASRPAAGPASLLSGKPTLFLREG